MNQSSIEKNVEVFFVPSDQKTIFINVDSYENSVFKGTVFSPFYRYSKPYESLVQLLLLMEQLLDELHLPETSDSLRSFENPCSPYLYWKEEPHLKVDREGKLATFKVDVLFRKKSSWQGSVFWLNQEKQECFRSVLELIKLMDSALQYAQASIPVSVDIDSL